MSKRNAQVVITRKDKQLRKGWHLLAFMLTGGASAPISAAKAATNAGYNARTRKLAEGDSQDAPQAAAKTPAKHRPARHRPAGWEGDWDVAAEWRSRHVPSSREYQQRHQSQLDPGHTQAATLAPFSRLQEKCAH